jgi:hypothetical protein
MCPLSDLLKIGVNVRDIVVAEDAYLAGMPELFMGIYYIDYSIYIFLFYYFLLLIV